MSACQGNTLAFVLNPPNEPKYLSAIWDTVYGG